MKKKLLKYVMNKPHDESSFAVYFYAKYPLKAWAIAKIFFWVKVTQLWNRFPVKSDSSKLIFRYNLTEDLDSWKYTQNCLQFLISSQLLFLETVEKYL